MISGTVGAGGVATLTTTIPNNAALVGRQLVFQGATADPALSAIAWTCAIDFLIHS